jgi:nicotinamide phosphoribosyltransferase
MKINPIYLKDFYKVGHKDQYPDGTSLIFSNFTPRKSRMPGVNHSVFFGLQYFIKRYLQKEFKTVMIDSCHPTMDAVAYKRFLQATLGMEVDTGHILDLLRLGYLPIAIYALPELTVVPSGIPALVMFNTHPDFYWLPGMLETLLSCTLWGASTSATIAREYRLILDEYAEKTSDIPEFVDYQAHDFSFRGMFGVEAACISGMAHLQYFKGTDTIPALIFNEHYYDKPLHPASVPATEHSVMCAGGKENEFETFSRLINTVYPSGIVSIVSDSWDLWRVVTDYLPRLKNDIMARNGKVVIRPDSGDPIQILCGTDPYVPYSCYEEQKGLIESLWDIFGGTINSKGYKQLDPHIGAIYGDSITLNRCRNICERLEAKGFASTNVVFGIGSYSYQYNTRDTLGWAMKATYAKINGQGVNIFKDPITDDGTKKSAKGLLKVVSKEGWNGKPLGLELKQECTWDEFHADDNELKLVYKNGVII